MVMFYNNIELKWDILAQSAIVGFVAAWALHPVIKHHAGRCSGKGVPGQQPTTMAQCVASGADPQCCLAAAAHHNPGINNPDPNCGMKGYYMNNCCNCGQPECGGGNTYPTGSVKPGQRGYDCLATA